MHCSDRQRRTAGGNNCHGHTVCDVEGKHGKVHTILNAYEESLGKDYSNYKVPPKWDGRAAERIWKVLCSALNS
jgi:hypothetical protein